MTTFASLALPAPVGKALAQLGFEQPTPIQAQAIPLALEGKDLIGCAQTGTGKTAAFCVPIFSRFLADHESLALVLVPTRELAKQIEDFWVRLTQGNRDFNCTSLIGGMPMQPQIRSLSRNPRMVIATPGRLIDHLERGTIGLDYVSVLVLDEADRMLDMGFEPQLSKIAKFLPKERQTLLFSATMQDEAERLSKKFVKDPVRISVGEISRAAEKIEQHVLMTEGSKKNTALLDEINGLNDSEGSILVFTRTKSRTDRVARYLSEFGLDVARIHGGRSQGQRNAALNDFRSGKARILVATDIAARGIDVAHVRFVVNYDLPQVAEDYVHRIGRTGRAGLSGQAISLVTHEERPLWRDIVALLKKTGSEMPNVRGNPTVDLLSIERQKGAPATGGRPGGRPHSKGRRPHRHPRSGGGQGGGHHGGHKKSGHRHGGGQPKNSAPVTA